MVWKIYPYEKIYERFLIRHSTRPFYQKNPFQHLERASIDVKIIKIQKGRGGETVSHISEKVKPVVNATRVETWLDRAWFQEFQLDIPRRWMRIIIKRKTTLTKLDPLGFPYNHRPPLYSLTNREMLFAFEMLRPFRICCAVRDLRFSSRR